MATPPGKEALNRIFLPQVTLCAATSVNIKATLRALQASMEKIVFSSCKLFTDVDITLDHPDISILPIRKIGSSEEYSKFMLSDMANYVETSHCLVVQWDGHVLNAERWRSDFLSYDYIGATWPQFKDGYDVGNGGFSLRSRRLMEACRDAEFQLSHPEDVAIGRENRKWLERIGMHFAPSAIADLFATERTGDLKTSFGYHGVWNMPKAIGIESFWQVYQELDDLGTVRHDFTRILKDVGDGPAGYSRMMRMILDYTKHHLGARK
ncbi:hypothetical protein CAF53_25525 (plasmid) [Sphingobium sp. LB126]|uniref:DUF5672 family protein n=1 Tax=Sphingobium sp. LB126 TaxID=1983755 RepID=UPI000C201571|nr:DUF5672 family protein [Sphingobium sp. LB126]PJG45165.1 hypothetical protein CAF53_25525 [Sphingobium sp. LB126]